ncbi:MAG TPA: bifunctional phosphoribosylaminoimidazolecarboxamide formyltransferase/IMP cyclohydrolase [Flavobacteriales bacterium]|nr:bifunctional phosphoribosylaminoimidazolecarboxamide formyltransferase/IMP cyclohydrolase [Flavobacteriales bacterium]
MEKTIKSALISVFYKDGLEPVIEALKKHNVTIYSTGGTQSFIEKLGGKVVAVEDVTGYPSILGGRVKTLHPKVFGGILARRDNTEDVATLDEYEIPQIDLVIVDLYPFEETVAKGGAEDEVIEKIDIGGVSLIRAAAKNFKDTLIVCDKADYAPLAEVINTQQAKTTLDQRKHHAGKAFHVTSHYDGLIFKYFDKDNAALKISVADKYPLRYGENPHQQAAFFGKLEDMFDRLHGKELSYNNLLDVDAAVNMANDFTTKDTLFAILKHNNACGFAIRKTGLEAWNAALAGDPVSAFGGVIITNKEIDEATAAEIDKLFCEVLIAPAYTAKALEILKSKKNRIILIQKPVALPQFNVRSALNGVLWQQRDNVVDTNANFTAVTEKKATAQEISDLEFANILVKHTKSNTIILAKDNTLLAGGTGQTSRVDALKQAIDKAKAFGFDLNGAVMASDAFFPFPDCVEIAHKVGITAVVQPGGSIKDKESIDYCNKAGMAMVFTGNRHFKH